MTSPATHARDAVIEALQGSATVTAFIPADRHYPNKIPHAPVKPFLRTGPIEGDVERLSGWRGARCDGAVHVHVAVSDAIPDPETWANDCTDAIAGALDALQFCIVDRTLVIPDRAEADAYHGVVYYRYDAIEAL